MARSSILFLLIKFLPDVEVFPLLFERADADLDWLGDCLGLLYTGDFDSLSNTEQDSSNFVGFLREPLSLETVPESLLLVKL